MIPYGKQEITQADLAAVQEALQGAMLTNGPYVPKFEQLFANYCGAKYATAVNNGTSALHLAVQAAGATAGKKWITTPLTFAASGNSILYTGAQVDFVDIESKTLCLDLNQVEDKLKTGEYNGVVAVDFAGYPVNMEELRKLADRYGVSIVQDAAHSLGGWFLDSNQVKRVCGDGSLAHFTTFSFHPVKHITTGEGGMITTNIEHADKLLKQNRSHGMNRNPKEMEENHGPWYMEMQTLGFNYRLSDINAALGCSQISRAAANVEKRRAIASRYDQAFEQLPLQLIIPEKNIGHAYHLYVIQLEKRAEMAAHLKSKGVMTQVHYIPLHTMPYYKNMGFAKGQFTVAENAYEKMLSIPMFPNLTETEINTVIEAVSSFNF